MIPVRPCFSWLPAFYWSTSHSAFARLIVYVFYPVQHGHVSSGSSLHALSILPLEVFSYLHFSHNEICHETPQTPTRRPVTEVERLPESVQKLLSRLFFFFLTYPHGWIKKKMLVPILQGQHETEVVTAS